MAVVYPTVADAKAIHRKEIEAAGGSRGLRDTDALRSAVMRPRQTFDDADLYPDILSKAAALFESLVSNHPFVDGNKRTAVVMAISFLEANGLHFEATNDEVERFTLEAASGAQDFDAICCWLESHTEEG